MCMNAFNLIIFSKSYRDWFPATASCLLHCEDKIGKCQPEVLLQCSHASSLRGCFVLSSLKIQRVFSFLLFLCLSFLHFNTDGHSLMPGKKSNKKKRDLHTKTKTHFHSNHIMYHYIRNQREKSEQKKDKNLFYTFAHPKNKKNRDPLQLVILFLLFFFFLFFFCFFRHII